MPAGIVILNDGTGALAESSLDTKRAIQMTKLEELKAHWEAAVDYADAVAKAAYDAVYDGSLTSEDAASEAEYDASESARADADKAYAAYAKLKKTQNLK